jgi:hypothetical protein
MMKKQKPPEKPQAEMSEQEKLDEWRRKRAQSGTITRPGGKVMGKQKREAKD